jgi:hypothetical protein
VSATATATAASTATAIVNLPPERAPRVKRAPMVTRQRLCIALGILWLLDGVLQLQSFMFSPGFANSIVAPTASGQPAFVSVPVEWNAHLIASHPVLLNAVFASVQLLLGIGFLFRRTTRLAIVGSFAWALGVWYLGEGLGGLAGGHVTGFGGAPGASLLYGVLALAAWPSVHPSNGRRPAPPQRPAPWPRWIWATLWSVLAVLTLLPGNASAHAISAQLIANASNVPSWLAAFDRVSASSFRAIGFASVLLVAAGQLVIGLGVLSTSRVRELTVYAGLVLAVFFWAAGQNFGQLLSGQATDPNTGPLIVLLGLTVLAGTRRSPSAHEPDTPVRMNAGA